MTIVVVASLAALLGRPAEQTVEAVPDDVATDVDGPGGDDPDGTSTADVPEIPAAVGAAPLPVGAVDCSLTDAVTAVPCAWWVVQLDRFPTTGPAVAHETVAIGARPDVVGLDMNTGEVRWVTELGRVAGLTADRDGTGIVAWTDVGDLVALEPFGGRIVWRAPSPVEVVDAALVQGWVVASSASGLQGWKIDDSAKDWHVAVSGQPSPLGVGDGVVAAGDGQGDVRFVDVDTGEVRWTSAAGTWSATVTPDGSLVLATGFDSRLVALDTRDGEVAWESPKVLGWVEAEVIPGTERVAVHHVDDGTLVVVDAATGTVVAEEHGLGDLVGATVDGWALVHAAERLLAYDAQRADGSIGWELDLDGEPVGAPAVAYPRSPDAPFLVTVTTEGRVVATPLPSRVP